MVQSLCSANHPALIVNIRIFQAGLKHQLLTQVKNPHLFQLRDRPNPNI